MNHVRFFTIGTALLFGLTIAQYAAPKTGVSGNGDLPTVEQQMVILTGKLSLSADQQTKIKPAIQELHDETLKLINDKSLTREERLAKIRPWRFGTDKRIRAVLSDEQKRKLDQYEQGPTPELHGSLN